MKYILFALALGIPAAAVAQDAVALKSSVFVARAVTDAQGKKKNQLFAPERVLPGEALVIILDYKNNGAKPAANFLVKGNHTRARVDHEQRNICAFHRRLGLLAHSSGECLRVFILKARRINNAERHPEQVGVAFAAVAGYPRPVIDKRKLFANQAVEQGRFTNIGPPDDGDHGERGGHLLDPYQRQAVMRPPLSRT